MGTPVHRFVGSLAMPEGSITPRLALTNGSCTLYKMPISSFVKKAPPNALAHQHSLRCAKEERLQNNPAVSLHDCTFRLLALLQVAFFLLGPGRRTLLPLHTLDGHVLLSFSMPPAQQLPCAAVHVLDVDGPAATAYLHIGACTWEMVLREVNLGGCVLVCNLPGL